MLVYCRFLASWTLPVSHLTLKHVNLQSAAMNCTQGKWKCIQPIPLHRYNIAMHAVVQLKVLFPNTVSFQSNLETMDVTLIKLNRTESFYENFGTSYSTTGFNIVLQRKGHAYIFKYYIPCVMMVVSSWVGFLINPSAIPGRITLSITLLLVLTSAFATIQVLNKLICTAKCTSSYYLYKN